jgi:hypothetical protein
MWLFVFIVATFFYLYITIGFACLTPKGRVAGQRGCSALGLKIRVQNEVFAGACGGKYHFVSGDFSSKAKRISPSPHVKLWQASEISG